MQLPSNQVGISDILEYRRCPQRAAFGMRRHVPLPERFALFPGEKDNPPEGDTEANAYGSCVHDAIQVIEETQCSDQQAIDAVWPTWQHWLWPTDLDRMLDDLSTYRKRSDAGYRVIGAELELRMPLYKGEDGEWRYFRARIDVLYQALQNPSLFVTRDYKSSRYARSWQEVQEDLQQWCYNAVVHYNYPECESLTQQYDQLRYGSIPTHKSQKQRSQIFRWLVQQVKAMESDEILAPKQNEWCKMCPLVMDCRVTHLSTDWWRAKLDALAPETKKGRKTVVELHRDLTSIQKYVAILPDAKNAKGQLERFISELESVIKQLPDAERKELGYDLTRPSNLSSFTADSLRRAHERLGDDIWQVATITKSGLEAFYGEGSDEAEEILAMAESKQGSPKLKHPKAKA